MRNERIYIKRGFLKESDLTQQGAIMNDKETHGAFWPMMSNMR
jgi:hypothetical protein